MIEKIDWAAGLQVFRLNFEDQLYKKGVGEGVSEALTFFEGVIGILWGFLGKGKSKIVSPRDGIRKCTA